MSSPLVLPIVRMRNVSRLCDHYGEVKLHHRNFLEVKDLLDASTGQLVTEAKNLATLSNVMAAGGRVPRLYPVGRVT